MMCRLCLAVFLAVSAQSFVDAEVFRSGFELGQPNKPTGWTLHDNGMSVVTTRRAMTGRRSLQITDTDDGELGSSCYSKPIKIQPGQTARITLSCFLESGDVRGLGLYLEFLNADGKRVGERNGYRQQLTLNTWNPMINSRVAPDGATQVRAWLHTISDSVITCNVDNCVLAVIPTEPPITASGWDGAVLDSKRRKDWIAGVRWDHGQTAYVDYRIEKTQDWSQYKTLSMNVYSERNTGSSFVLIFTSENQSSEGPDYYSIKIPVDFEGWKKLQWSLSDIRTSREPLGWNHIDSVKLRANGYSQELNPKTIVVIDGVKLQ